MRLGCGNSPQCNGCGGGGAGGAGGAYPPTTNLRADRRLQRGRRRLQGRRFRPCSAARTSRRRARRAVPAAAGDAQGMHMAGGGFAGRCPGCPTRRCRRPSNAPLPGMRSTGTTSGSRSPGSGASTPSGAGGGGGGRRGRGGGGGNSGRRGAGLRRGGRRPDVPAAAAAVGALRRGQVAVCDRLGEAQGGAGRAHHADDQNIPNKYNQKLLLTTIERHHACKFDLFYLPPTSRTGARRLRRPDLASPAPCPLRAPRRSRAAPRAPLRSCNVGYAFINFLSPAHILAFYESSTSASGTASTPTRCARSRTAASRAALLTTLPLEPRPVTSATAPSSSPPTARPLRVFVGMASGLR